MYILSENKGKTKESDLEDTFTNIVIEWFRSYCRY